MRGAVISDLYQAIKNERNEKDDDDEEEDEDEDEEEEEEDEEEVVAVGSTLTGAAAVLHGMGFDPYKSLAAARMLR